MESGRHTFELKVRVCAAAAVTGHLQRLDERHALVLPDQLAPQRQLRALRGEGPLHVRPLAKLTEPSAVDRHRNARQHGSRECPLALLVQAAAQRGVHCHLVQLVARRRQRLVFRARGKDEHEQPQEHRDAADLLRAPNGVHSVSM